MRSLANGAKQSHIGERKSASRPIPQGKRTHSLPKPLPKGVQARGKDEPLGDFAYRVLRDAIRSGKIVPHEHLREADVAQWLNISRTPVREAFHRLISQSLLTNGPWNGVMVADLDLQQLTELYAVRESLEGTAANLAARHATSAELDDLSKIVAFEGKGKRRPEKYVVINRELHQMIYQAAHNRYLLQSLNTVVDALGLLHHSTFVLPGSIEQAHRDHVQIISAIRNGEPEKAAELAREHVRHSLEMRLQLHKDRSAGSAASTTGLRSRFRAGSSVASKN
jgi:DNA-binding GntR family transcriptional regulator